MKPDNKDRTQEKLNYDSYSINNKNKINTFQKNNNRSQMELERCDGCFDGEGTCFCINCEKIYCKICEDQIHVVPINRLHER